MSGEATHRTLIKDAAFVVTMDPGNRVLEGASVSIVGNTIEAVGEIEKEPDDTIIDAAGKLVIPGLINTHHHTSQGLLKAYPDIQNRPIAEWIDKVTRVLKHMTPIMAYDATLSNLAEFALYGGTTMADMSYVTMPGKHFVAPAIDAASTIKVRSHLYVGGMSLSQKNGALFPDYAAQDSDTIAQQIVETIESHHDPSPDSMHRIGVGLCAIYTNMSRDFINAVRIGDRYGVALQTHVGESEFENEYSLKYFRQRPIDRLRNLGWAGSRASLVHCINVNDSEIKTLATDGTQVAHCPISNARSSVGEAGIAPITEMLAAGVNVGIGVDGSAGNDSSNLLEELRWVRTIQGARLDTTYLDPAQVLRMGTVGGAQLLMRGADIGSLEPGKLADLAIFDLDTPEMAGAWDPITALLSTQVHRANLVMINGEVVVEDGQLTTIDMPSLLHRMRQHVRHLREAIN